MNTEKVEKFKEKLLEIRTTLIGDVEKVRKYSAEEVSGEVPDINDDAARTYSRQVLLHIGEKERVQLNEVNDSLQMILDKEYGSCKECGETIPDQRLDLIPYTKFCVTCQEVTENPE